MVEETGEIGILADYKVPFVMILSCPLNGST